ncbi:MAG: hypothetical protein IJT36_02830 [Alphaproteobacteria bacterium]|nr:hypothetical protein [Alphaproteobacteria bacterium]
MLFCLCYSQMQAVGHEASLCLGVCNSTDKKIVFVVKPLSDAVISSKTISNFNLDPQEHFFITEHFIDFNQYKIGESKDVVLREIEIMCDGTTLGTMQLICSKFCPDPFYIVKEDGTNPFGFVV